MIALTDIFEQIRRNRRYLKKGLQETLGISKMELTDILLKKNIPVHLLTPWARYLDFTDMEIVYIHQYHDQYSIFTTLPPSTVATRALFAKTLDCWSRLPETRKQEVRAMLTKTIIPYLLNQPSRFADAIEEIVCQTSNQTTN